MILGLTTAPIFTLLTLSTETTRMVSLQVAVSVAAGPRIVAPSQLVLGVGMASLYVLAPRTLRERCAP